MNAQREARTCAITGVNGYLGGRLKEGMFARGWRVLEMARNPAAGSRAIRFELGREVSARDLEGAEALVHCAYDFRQLNWAAIHATNVAGTEKLFSAARRAGVRHLVYMSTISAYEGCRSLYGKAKLECEVVAAQAGAVVIRPGLIWGERPGAMYGRLVNQVQRARILPLFGGGAQRQYLVHELDLAECVARAVEGRVASAKLVTVAHEQARTFREILEQIAVGLGKPVRFVPVPWRLIWAALKTAETFGVPLGFRSDSLLSLMYQNPSPSFEEQRHEGLVCRPFEPKFNRV